MDWKGKRVLVTGGAGFIGSHVCDELAERGASVSVYDNFSTGFREFVRTREGVQVIEANLLDPSRLTAAMRGVDFVFHLAANADIKDNLKEPRKCIDENVVATQNVLEAMRAEGVRQVAFASTGSVYGEAAVFPTPEDAPFPIQTSLYATSKLAAEGLLSSYALGFGFSVWIFRFVSVLGPRYTHGHVIDFWRKLRRDPTRLEVLGNGLQEKSYLHVADCVAAIFTAVDRSTEAINIFNLGHTGSIRVNDSIAIIARALGISPRLDYTGGERGWVGDSPKILLDTSRIRRLGWDARKSIEESIVETLRFLRDNPYTDRRA
ncbi:MAG TPA: NAD-dependent epimerase/dehydratase family protein [Polyangiaceae bacterium]|nr:NAD-dependent epimerase/dehydratase family protein [Polyangiaceae bacterium]